MLVQAGATSIRLAQCLTHSRDRAAVLRNGTGLRGRTSRRWSCAIAAVSINSAFQDPSRRFAATSDSNSRSGSPFNDQGSQLGSGPISIGTWSLFAG